MAYPWTPPGSPVVSPARTVAEAAGIPAWLLEAAASDPAPPAGLGVVEQAVTEPMGILPLDILEPPPPTPPRLTDEQLAADEALVAAGQRRQTEVPPPPPAPEVDVISGADPAAPPPPAPVGETEYAADAAGGKNAPSWAPPSGPIRGTLAEEAGSVGRAHEIAAQKEEALARGLQRQADFQKTALEDYQARQMERRKDLRDRNVKLEAERTAIANTVVDPNAWWESRSQAQKGMAMIGAFLGGYNDIEKNGNDFLDFMQQQVSNNLEAQKATLANRQQSLTQGLNLYGQLLQQYGDEELADQQFIAMGYKYLGDAAAAEAAKYSAPAVREAGHMAQIQSVQKANEAGAAAAERAQKLAIDRAKVKIDAFDAETRRNQAIQAGQIAAGELQYKYDALGANQAKEQRAIDEAKRLEAKADRALMMRNPDGSPLVSKKGELILGGGPEIADKQRKSIGRNWEMRGLLNEYLKLARDAGPEFNGIPGVSKTDVMARMDHLYEAMMYVTKSVEGTGALDKGMVDTFNLYIAPPRTWLGKSNPTASAEQALKGWESKTNNMYNMELGYEGQYVQDWDEKTGRDPASLKRENDRLILEARQQPSVQRKSAPPPKGSVGGEVAGGIEYLATGGKPKPAPVAPPAPAEDFPLSTTSDGGDAPAAVEEEPTPPLGARVDTVTVYTGSGSKEIPVGDLQRFGYSYMRTPGGDIVSVANPPLGFDMDRGVYIADEADERTPKKKPAKKGKK